MYMSTSQKHQDYLFLGDSTVFQAEIVAISEACKDMLNRNIREHEIDIHIDSQSAIKATGCYETKSKLVLECKELLNQLANHNMVNLKWIPGHEGHLGNEIADRLAKRGSMLEVAGPEPHLPTNSSFLKKKLKDWEIAKHNTEWRNRNDCRQTKLLMPKRNTIWTKEILKTDRKNIRIMTQIITGHANLNRHRYLMGLEPDPICNECMEDEETMEHLLAKCPVYAQDRYELLGGAITSIDQIRTCKIKNITNFVKRTGKLQLE